MKPERHLVALPAGGGTSVHVRTSGDASAPELLLLHQVPASGRMWLPVMAALEPLSCIAPDMLNLGESDATDEPLTLAEHAETLWTAAQALRPGPKIVVGHHTGAALAAALAATHPDEVRGLAMIGYPYYRGWKDRFARFERLDPTGVDDDGAGVAAVWRFVRRAFADDADPDTVFDAFADRIRAGRIWYEGYVALFTTDLDRLARAARADERQTLLVAPDRDVLSGRADEAAALFGIAATRIPGGAFVLTEDPASVAGLLRDLADRVRAR